MSQWITAAELPADGLPVVGVLMAPFHNYNGAGFPEMVFGFAIAKDQAPARARRAGADASVAAVFAAGMLEATRPFALRIGGEGWIRLERQLGKNVLAWPEHWIALRRGKHPRGAYVEVVEGK